MGSTGLQQDQSSSAVDQPREIFNNLDRRQLTTGRIVPALLSRQGWGQEFVQKRAPGMYGEIDETHQGRIQIVQRVRTQFYLYALGDRRSSLEIASLQSCPMD